MKWCELAERRRDYYIDLHLSGRWRRYYSEESFFQLLRAAIEDADEWDQIVAQTQTRSSHTAIWRQAG